MVRLSILVLAAALAFTCYRLADVERQRYAMVVGVCSRDEADLMAFARCVQTVQPRTSFWWNLYYGLGIDK